MDKAFLRPLGRGANAKKGEERRPPLQWALRVLARDDYRATFEALLSSRPPIRLSSLAERAGYPTEVVKSRLRRLLGMGFRFRADINETAMGLTTLFVSLKKPVEPDPELRVRGFNEVLKWTLRWKANSLIGERRGFMMFYVPMDLNAIESIVDEVSSRFPVEESLVLIETLRNRPSPDTLTRDFAKTDWGKVFEFDFRDSPGASISSLGAELGAWPVRVDLLDLLIAAAYHADALTKPSALAKRLGVSRQRLMKHLEGHAARFFTGVSIARSVATDDLICVLALGRGDLGSCRLLLLALRRAFEFSVGSISDSDRVIFLLALRPDNLAKSLEIINANARRLGVELSFYVLDNSSIESYTVPFLSFSQHARGWDLNASMIEFMKAKLRSLL
ncbi:MAG: Lrp/AsnC family transcriptional regulator [Fervidicoccaceae archaeon]